MTWMEHAACVQRPGLAWIDDLQHVPDVVLDEMRAVCAACPVVEACSTYVEGEDVTGGFWAGQDRALVEREQLCWGSQLALPGFDDFGDAA